MHTLLIRGLLGTLLGGVLLAAAHAAPPPPALPPLSAPPAAVEAPQGYQAPPKTLEKIARYGAIYVGHREASVPFSYMDEEGKPHGYSWELCMRVVDAVKAKLNMPALEVVPVLVTSSSRLLMVQAGTIDLNCGSATNTEQRGRYVAFSNTIFVAGVRALVRKDAGIKSLADLGGKTIVTTAGTTSDSYVKQATARRNIFANYRSARTHLDSFSEVLNGRADAFVLDDILLQGLLANAPQADAYKLVLLDESVGYEPYGLIMRKNDPEFKKLVDDVLVGLFKSGEIERIYAKWFLSAIPPNGINLNAPMSPELKQLIKTPNDRGI